MPASDSYAAIYDFNCSKCGVFGGTPVVDRFGNVWGTAETAGPTGYGMVYKLSFSGVSWTLSDVHDFTGGADGKYPSSIAVDENGNVFGVTLEGGDSQDCSGLGCGTIWEVTQ
jgi:hypothetical protein